MSIWSPWAPMPIAGRTVVAAAYFATGAAVNGGSFDLGVGYWRRCCYVARS